MLSTITKGTVAVFLVLVISGCGFQLRGSAGFPAELSPLYLSEQQNTVYSSLSTQLRQNGVTLSAQQENAHWRLWLSEPRHSKKQTTYTSGSSSYELLAEVDYQLLDQAGKAVNNQHTLRTSRTYVSNDNLYSEASDIAALRLDMERDLANRISRQLSQVSLPELPVESTPQANSTDSPDTEKQP